MPAHVPDVLLAVAEERRHVVERAGVDHRCLSMVVGTNNVSHPRIHPPIKPVIQRTLRLAVVPRDQVAERAEHGRHDVGLRVREVADEVGPHARVDDGLDALVVPVRDVRERPAGVLCCGGDGVGGSSVRQQQQTSTRPVVGPCIWLATPSPLPTWRQSASWQAARSLASTGSAGRRTSMCGCGLPRNKLESAHTQLRSMEVEDGCRIFLSMLPSAW